MEIIEIEVTSLHYTGKLQIESVDKNYSLFSVYLNDEFLGHIQPVKIKEDIQWYCHEITDKELLAQIGEWAEFHFPLTEKSFKSIFNFKIFPKFLGGILAATLYAGQAQPNISNKKSLILIPHTETQRKALK